MQWLNENDDSSMEILKNAYLRDAEDGVSCQAPLKGAQICQFH